MKIYNLQCKNTDDLVTISVTVESDKLETKELWFSTSQNFSNHICRTRMDAFVVGLLYPAMQIGEDIYVDGVVSKKLLFNINNYIIPLLLSFSESAKKIKVSASKTTSNKINCNGIGTGFSGGVDSFSTIYNRFEKEIDSEMRINSLLFLNVGSHGFEQKSSQLKFKERYKYLESFPREMGLEFAPLDSNLHQFHPWGHQETHTLTSISGVLVMQNYFSKYYYSSAGLNYGNIINDAYKYKGIDIGVFCDAILLPLLSTETTEFILDGAADTRTDKILDLANYNPTFKYLNVCVSGDDTHENCSVCPKCLRTLLTLDLSDNLEKYSNLFDIAKYKISKGHYLYLQVASKNKDSFAKDNIELARDNKIILPGFFISSLFFLTNYGLKSFLKKTIKTLSPKMFNKIKKHYK